jgi:Putative Flp pilus-assembly TadE/G-like
MRDLMASLTRLVQVRLRRDERGVVAVIVALLLGAGVLTGMVALVVDVGQIYQERAELQNGADAAALGVAKSCALGTCTPAVAGQLADGNASSLTGGTEGVPLVCGSGSLGSCPASSGNITDCPPPPAAGTNFVDVYTATETPSGSTLLPPVFATTLLGGSSYQGQTVRACAQAEWGAPSAATADALTISACEWDQATQQGTLYAPAPPYSVGAVPAAGFDQVLTQDPGNGVGCGTQPAGADGPGTFGWAGDATGNCSLPVSGPSFEADTRPLVTAACQLVLQSSQQDEIPILVPIYVSLNGAAGTYALDGFADFVVTGYNLAPGLFAADWLNPTNTCQGTDYCLTGYFVQGVIAATGSLTGTYLGSSVIDLTG